VEAVRQMTPESMKALFALTKWKWLDRWDTILQRKTRSGKSMDKLCTIEGPVILQWIRSSSWSRKVIQYGQITISPASRPLRNDFFFWRHIPYHRARMVKISLLRKKKRIKFRGSYLCQIWIDFQKIREVFKALEKIFQMRHCAVFYLILFKSYIGKHNTITFPKWQQNNGQRNLVLIGEGAPAYRALSAHKFHPDKGIVQHRKHAISTAWLKKMLN